MTRLLALSRLKARVGRAGALLTAFVGLMVIGQAARAACTFPDLNIEALPLTLDVARDHFDIGSVISETTQHGVSVVCDDTTKLSRVNIEVVFGWSKKGDVVIDGSTYAVYGGAASPIGIIVEVGIDGGAFTPLTLEARRNPDLTYPQQELPFPPQITGGVPFDVSVRTRLVAMGPIALSTTYDFYFAGFAIRFVGNQVSSSILLGLRSSVTVNAASCTLVNENQTVAMRSIAAGNFDGSGKTFHETPFELAIDCPATSTGINVWATLSDATDPGNVGSHLTLTGSQPAKGVAIELLHADTKEVVMFGPDSSAKGNLHQFEVASAPVSGQSVSMPFIARYVQTAPVVEPGDANASATVTFSYQ